MYKNRFILVLGLLSMLLAGMAVTQPHPLVSSATGQAASDFYQRHPDWTWEINDQDAVIPLTGDSAFPDYFQRHPELKIPVFSAEQIRREYMLGERYGTTAQSIYLREFWLGERYGQRP